MVNKKTFVRSLILSLILLFSQGYTYTTYAEDTRLFYDGAYHVYTAKPIKLVVNGKEMKNLPMSPVVFDGYTLVPAREVFEPLGAVVTWNESSQEVLIGYGSKLIVLQQDNIYAYINGERVRVASPPKNINGKLMVPTRFISEAIGLGINWNDDTRTVSISSGGYSDNQNSAPVNNTTPSSSVSSNTDSVGVNTTGLARDVSPAPISEENNDETKIIDIVAPSAANNYSFGILASSPISKVEKMLLWDNRLVIDIHNAEMSLLKTSYETPNTPATIVRAGQNAINPVKITRIVLELNSSVDYRVSISSDRRQIIVSFERNKINDISFSSDGTNDYVFLTFEGTPTANLFALANPYRIVIDSASSTISNIPDKTVSGRFVSAIRAGQPDSATSRVVLDMKADASYEMEIRGNTLTVKLSTPTYRNIFVDIEKSVIKISKNGSFSIKPSAVGHRDLYNQGQYIFTLPGDYSSLLGYGKMAIGTNYIDAVDIKTNGSGQTEITVNQKQILAYDITEDSSFIYITPMSPKQKYQHVVMLDPGHGGNAPGAIANGITEKEGTLDIILRTLKFFDGSNGIKAYAIRIDDSSVDYLDRALIANQIADLFVSVHLNSLDLKADSKNAEISGTETYYYPHDNDNYIGVTSKTVAEILQKNLLKRLGSQDRKVKTNNYAVLTNTTVPAVLAEIGFITNLAEAKKLATPEYRQKAAEAIYESVVEIFTNYRIVR